MDLAQVGQEVRTKRVQTGLLQEQLARLSGLSRVTINKLENGTLNDLGYTKVRAVLDILGVSVSPVDHSGLKNALAITARSISTSYRDVVTPAILTQMLRSGQAPKQFQPHLMVLLEELPLQVVVKAVTEAATCDVPAHRIMKNLSSWAKLWRVRRSVW